MSSTLTANTFQNRDFEFSYFLYTGSFKSRKAEFLTGHLTVCFHSFMPVVYTCTCFKFRGMAGSEDFACATLPTTPFHFQDKV